jgi:DUF917 family protein
MAKRGPTEVIRPHDVDALAVGVSLLGSGSGGNPLPFATALTHRLKGSTLPIFDPRDWDGPAVVPVGIVGSTSVFAEKLPRGDEFSAAVAAVCRWTGVNASAVIALEAGGVNGMAALLAALEAGLPFVDADLMGRAMPRLTQFTWATRGVPLTPSALSDPNGQVIVIDGVDAAGLERSVRAFVAESGGWAALALHPTETGLGTGEAIVGSIGRALRLGRAQSTLPSSPPLPLVEERLGGRVVASGRMIEVERRSAAGSFGRGSTTLVDSSTSAVVRLEMENELLLAIADGTPVASCPDILCVLDRRTARPVAVDSFREGLDVMVLTLPAPSWWLQGDVLSQVGPQAFDLNCAPILMETPA